MISEQKTSIRIALLIVYLSSTFMSLENINVQFLWPFLAKNENYEEMPRII